MSARETMGLAARRVGVTLGGNAVLHDVSVGFAAGRVSVLLGANGAGKSTLLSCLAGLRQPHTGMVRLDGTPVSGLPRRERARRIGFLPQVPEVHWDVDVATLVALGRLPWRGRGGEADADRRAVDDAMRAVDVTGLAARSASQLSGGERARVLIARVLAGQPQWLLADEPLANLDPAHQLDVLAQLQAIARAGVGVVLVLHDLGLAARVADFVVLLREGRLLAAGPGEAVLQPQPIREAFEVEAHFGRIEGVGRMVIPVRRNGL